MNNMEEGAENMCLKQSDFELTAFLVNNPVTHPPSSEAKGRKGRRWEVRK